MRNRDRTPALASRERIMAFAEGAACQGRDVLYTTDARHLNKGALRAMQQVCAECPVVGLCAEFAEEINPTCGVWAGKLYTTNWRRP